MNGGATSHMYGGSVFSTSGNPPVINLSLNPLDVYMYILCMYNVLCVVTCMFMFNDMRDKKEGRKKQARSNKQQGKATCTFFAYLPSLSPPQDQD